MVIALMILFNYLLSINEIIGVYFNKLLKIYTVEHFHKLISINQYFCYIFFKNLYMQSIVGFIPLICKIFFKKQPSWFPYFYTSVNIKLFLSINIISSLGLIFNKEIGFFIDYLLDINSLYELKEHADVILDTDSLKNEVIHIDLDDPKTAKFNKKIMQAVVLCTTISIIYLSMSSF